MIPQSRHSIHHPGSIAVAVAILVLLGGMGTFITISADKDIQTHVAAEFSKKKEIGSKAPVPGQGRAYLEAGRYKKAQVVLAAHLKKHPGDVKNRTLYAQALWQAGEEKQSLAQLERVIRSQPPDPELYYRAGLMYRQTGNDKRSLELLRKAASLESESMVFSAELAKGYVAAQRFDEAIIAWKKALKNAPKHSEVRAVIYAQLGLTYEEAGRPADARKTYKAGLKQDPENGYLSKLLSDMKASRP